MRNRLMRTKQTGILTLIIILSLFITTSTIARAAGGTAINVVNFAYEPATVTVQVGDTVTWENTEGFHTVDADDGSFGNAPGTGWTFMHTFTAPGTYEYFCEVHSTPDGTSMNGVVIVEAPTAVSLNGLSATQDTAWLVGAVASGILLVTGIVATWRRHRA
jgi:plastocyanin